MKQRNLPTREISPIRRTLFVLFAPVTVPLYILFLAATNLLGGAFYIVIEASLARVMRRPITLSRGQMMALALPVLLVAPIATAAHLVIFTVAALGRILTSAGRWQIASTSQYANFTAGLFWALIALWASATCLNAAVGMSLIGRPVRGADVFAEGYLRVRPLRDLPAYSQEQRKQMIADLAAGHEKVHPNWELLQEALQDDDCAFIRLPAPVRMKLVGMPWYFIPAAVSEDGMDHSELLLGPLVFVWMLLIRWPGTFLVCRGRVSRLLWYLVRTLGAAWAVFYLVTWLPTTDFFRFAFDPGAIPAWFKWLSPALLLGADPGDWVRPEWWLFNAGLWFILIGLAAFIWWAAWAVAPMLGWPRYYVAFLASRLLQRKRIAFFSVGAVTLCVAMMIIVISVMGGFSDVIRQRAHGLLGDLVMDAGGLQGFPFYQEFINKLKDLKDPKTGERAVVQATPVIHTYGVLQFPKTRRTASVNVYGIRFEEYLRVNNFDLFYNQRFGGTDLGPQQQPVYGRDGKGLPALPGDMDSHYQKFVDSLPAKERAEELKKYHREPADFYPGPGVFKGPAEKAGFEGKKYPGLILGRSILFRRMASGEFSRSEDYPRGETCLLTVLPISRGGDISPEPPPKPTFRYVDDSRTGIHEIDSVNVYGDFEFLQGLLSMGPEKRTEGGGMTAPRCNQVLIRLAPQFSASREKTLEMKRRIFELWNDFRADLRTDMVEEGMLRRVDIDTWEEMQASYISAIEKEKFLVLIMFGVISIVAVFLILCIFYMIVQEKTRDIGIIKSIGGSPAGVAAVFLAYGGAIGIVGCVLGSLLGTNFVHHINDVQDALARLNPNWRVWSPETYSFDKIPDVWKWPEVIGISILAVLASIAGAAIPAIRAGKTWPMESLRYE